MASSAGLSSNIPLILLIGELSFISVLQYVFENEGFSILTTDDGQEAVELSKRRNPSIVTVDTNLPRGSVGSVLRQIGENQRGTPVVLLATDMSEVGRISDMQEEPNAIVLKPFAPNTLVTRIRNLLDSPRLHFAEPTLRFDSILIDRISHKVYLDGVRVPLGPIEYRLLEHLVRHPREVFSRTKLIHDVWGNKIHVVPRTVDVHMSRIRKAISEITKKDLIRTVRSVGYSLDSE